ncbi:MAG: SGNH/GDSL hydrolase family protein [Tepidisphaeraceae bacterium]
MLLGKSQKLVFIGDSITDASRTRPAPSEGLFDPMGRGYVTLVDALLGATYPQLSIRVVNVGNSGNTVRDLKARWQTDVIDLAPDWLSIMIGINDVWRQFDSPRQKEMHVLPAEYEATLSELASWTRARLKGMVMMTPYYIESNPSDAMRARMDEYGAIVKKIAKKVDAICVDTQAAFDAALKHYYAGTLAWDRVHPNQTGHMILAKAFLNGVGFDWAGR